MELQEEGDLHQAFLLHSLKGTNANWRECSVGEGTVPRQAMGLGNRAGADPASRHGVLSAAPMSASSCASLRKPFSARTLIQAWAWSWACRKSAWVFLGVGVGG